jgi:SAM-dependent methyltransferase
MIHHKTCPLCSGSEVSHFLTCTDHFVTGEIFNICKCKECGFVFTQDYPEEGESGRYYDSEDYISHSNSKKGITEKAYQIARKIMLSRKRRLIRRETGLSSGNVLDIGSGTGHFLDAMKKDGWNISGLEINSKAREFAMSNFGIETLPPELMQTLPEESFDCITLWHVLEHFHEPYQLMEAIFNILKPEGVAIIALPNSCSFDCLYYGKSWAAWDVPRHLWHFSSGTFLHFALKNKFSVKGRGFLPFDVFYISILSEKYRGSHFPVFMGISNGFRFFFRSLFNKTGNSSIIYYLRKGRL